MRFSILAVGAFAALVSAQTPTSTAAPSVVSNDSAQSSQQAAIAACLKACAPGDVNCQAKCITVPNPDEGMVTKTNECVAACPKGNGTAADIEAYGKCTADCISKYYYTPGVGSQPTGAAGGGGGGSGNGNGGGNGGNNGATGTGGSNPTGTGAGQGGNQTQTRNAGDIVQAGGSALGFVGFLVAFLAL